MGEPSGVEVAAGRWDRARWTLLVVLSGNMLLDAVEVSLVLPALPSLNGEPAFPPGTAQWSMSGFALGFAVLLVLGPALTARWGRRRTYLAAMLLFATASVVSGLAGGAAVLIAARVVKGGCAALTAPAGLAVISTTFPEGPQQRAAVSVYSLFGAAGFTAGLLLSGALSAVSWRWTFLFPAPVALLLLLFALRAIPGGEHRAPLRISPALLRDRSFVRSAVGACSLNGTYIGVLLLITIEAARRFSLGPVEIAIALLPACVPLAVTVPFAARLVRRFGTRRLIAAGAGAALAGSLLYLARPVADSYATGPLPVLLLVEAGLVLSFTALNIQSTVTVESASRPAAVSLYQAAVQLGSVLVLPLVTALSAEPGPRGLRSALLAVCALAAIGVVAALAGYRGEESKRKVRT